MDELYHGGQVPHLEKLIPHESTHGKYVYATPNKDLAILFSVHKFDDLLLTIKFDEETKKYQIIERVPGVIEHAFKTSSSVYTVSKDGFMDIHTGFNELVSSSDVKVLKEEKIENVFDYLNSCDSFIIYNYPDRPKDIPLDDKDLFDKEIQHITSTNKSFDKDSFERLVLFHPNLIPVINSYVRDNHIDMELIDEKKLVNMFRKYISYQMVDLGHDFHLVEIMQMIIQYYPNLKETVKGEIRILTSSSQEKVNYMINTFYNELSDEKSKEEFVRSCKEMKNVSGDMATVGREIITSFKYISRSRPKSNVRVLKRENDNQGFSYILLLGIFVVIGLIVILITYLS